MKQKLKFILSSFTLLLFALLAGGSFDDIVAMFWILIGVLVIVAVAAIIQNIVQSKNKEKSKHSKKCTFYTLRFGCSFAAVNTIKPQLL